MITSTNCGTFLCGLDDPAMYGWFEELTDRGFKFVFWNKKTTPIFDLFDQIQPDIFINDIDITQGIARCLKDYPETTTLFYHKPNHTLSIQDVDNVKQLRNETGKPDYIFNFCKNPNNIVLPWKNLGFNVLSIPRGTNPKIFSRERYSKEWASDVCYIGDYDTKIAPFILPLCDGKFNVRIFGNGWPVSNAVGKVERYHLPNILCSTKIVVDVQDSNLEMSETIFNALACGVLCVSNSFEEQDFESPEQLYKLIDDTLNSNQLDKIKALGISIQSSETYSHHISSLLNLLELS